MTSDSKSPSFPMVAADIMTESVVTLSGDQSLEDLNEAMSLLRFRHMPVLDGDRVIGLVTLRDAAKASASSLLPSQGAQNNWLGERFRVADVMERDIRTVEGDASIEAIAELMQRHKLSCVPVVEGENRLLGLITESDFVKLAVRLHGLMSQSAGSE